MIVLKLLVITIFLLVSSKSLGIFVSKKTSLSAEISLGIGYMFNIAIFFVCSFIPMYFRLSTDYLMISGTIYSIICFASIWYAIKNRELFKFSKKEVLAIFIALVFTALFALFVDFGYADMYDSYFYNILSNSGTKANKLSMINPYNGISDLQTYYKYISFYLEPSYFANIFEITPAYVVLIWPFTFMAYYFLAITALGVARISKKNYINNIVSVFILTTYTTFFRAPFNYLYIVNILLPIYLFYFAFRSFRDKKFVSVYYIIFVAASACSSAILYTSAAFILALYISSYIKKNYDKLDILFKLAIPTYLLAYLYMLESSRTIKAVIIALIPLLIIGFIIRFKLVKRFARDVAIFLLIVIPITFVVAPRDSKLKQFSSAFVGRGVVADKLITTTEDVCVSNEIEVKDVTVDTDYNMFGTSMKYIYEGNTSLLNSALIAGTHSIFMYGGLLFFAIYGFFYRRKKHVYKMFIIYLVLFFNPFVSKGLALITMDLNNRIYLFFNTFYAIFGIVWFFEWLEELDIKFINKCVKYFYIPYAFLLCLSVYSYVALLKTIDYKNTSMLYKIPNNLVEASDEVNSIVSTKRSESKPIVFYSIDTLGLSVLDKNPNDNYKLVDSKIFKDYYFYPNILTNKSLVHLYFASNGEYDFDEIRPNIVDGKYSIKNCGINNLLTNYKVDYIVLGSKYKDAYDKIKDDYEIVYNKNDVLVLKRSR